MAYSSRFENGQTRKGFRGSNPLPSANFISGELMNDLAVDLAEQFLNAYDADDDGAQLIALRDRYGLQEQSILAAMFRYYASHS